jgi:hypothetical protein
MGSFNGNTPSFPQSIYDIGNSYFRHLLARDTEFSYRIRIYRHETHATAIFV